MEDIELSVHANGMNGEGIARYNGKVVFVDGALAGEIVIAKVIKENKNFINAKLVKILKQSEYRCTPKCQYFNNCGGCDLQHLEYKKQLELKAQNVQNLFDKTTLNFKVQTCQASDNFYEYRNKLTLYLNENNNLCFYKKNSKQLIEINNCSLVNEEFNFLINKLNYFLQTNKQFNRFILKGISIRQINDIFIIDLILTKKIILTQLQNYLNLNKINYSLYYCINNEKNSNIPLEPCYFVAGQQKIILQENGIKYPVFPLSFLQVNSYIKNLIYNQILEFTCGQNIILDAYSGAGLLSALVAKNSKKVYAVEISKSAIKACQELCKNNKINNVESICGDCAIEVPKLLQSTKIDCVILDPARKGVEQSVLKSIIDAKPNHIIYLSCNPATLARDLKILTCEYNIVFAKVYDMFPQTANVETLVKLERISEVDYE
ncbi:MAG: 23S rRNA (uracil(1939)-C(5))-methyltransferase RlmD [Clostridiales bacterium]|nr:23S rRNA (uracil(1939)-C(5))-methyltransferase RlmD [Clostridiales bacterium]